MEAGGSQRIRNHVALAGSGFQLAAIRDVGVAEITRKGFS